jgi:ubiquinone/menaquinone biosynthesis C-methylase UbiE
MYCWADKFVFKRSIRLPQEIPLELAGNLAAYRTTAAVDEYSVYRLFREENYLFSKFYKAGDSILDLACGLGRTTLLLHEMGLRVRGIDRSEIFIEIAKRRLPYLDLRAGSYDHIEEEDSSFCHVLISHNGIDCAYPGAQRVAALRECARVLKPGGTFIYSSHNLKSLHWFSPRYRSRLLWKLSNSAKAFNDWAYVVESGIHMFYASPDFVIRQTEEAGLRLVQMRWSSKFNVDLVDKYFAPYIYYVFVKPLH